MLSIFYSQRSGEACQRSWARSFYLLKKSLNSHYFNQQKLNKMTPDYTIKNFCKRCHERAVHNPGMKIEEVTNLHCFRFYFQDSSILLMPNSFSLTLPEAFWVLTLIFFNFCFFFISFNLSILYSIYNSASLSLYLLLFNSLNLLLLFLLFY